MKIYVGERDEEDNTLTVSIKVDGGRTYPLDPRYDVRNHSPTGFECGYSGSGPAQLALAICCDALGDVAQAERVYQQFKFKVIAGLPSMKDWELTETSVRNTIRELMTTQETEDPAK
jgi:hypothetical protein